MPPFSYASLPPLDSSTIRLLSLVPSRNETAALQGQLHNYSLQDSDKETHLYEALSYVWGGIDDPPHSIYINGNSLSITANLHAALLRLRNHTLERVMWVDALCINQQDDQEKGLQIQLMPRIYGQAAQVIVYLGEAADDSDMALESIRVAADDENEKPGNSLASKRSQESILSLLKRPWFQRIWVLQEVGLARSILIICGSVEMNGYTFCSGISKLESLLKIYADLQSLIRPTIHLIRGSIFRPKYKSSSLGELSLAELIDMYHNHKATVRHDKVYALLGMCSDHLSSTGLLPDYTIPWETLFRRLVNFILHQSMSIEAWDDRETAVIKSSGYVLGHVSSVRNAINRYPGQYIEVTFNNRPISFQYYKNYGAHWILQASAQPIRQNDIICLLEGASNPTVVRAFEDHFGIIMIAVNPRQQRHKHSSFQLSMSPTPDYSHEFLLVWQWGLISGQHSSLLQLPQMEINSVVPDYLKTNAIRAMRSFEVALILKDTGDLLMVEVKLKKDIEKWERLFGIDDIHILSLKEVLASVYWSSNRWKMAENLLLEVIRARQYLQGKCHQDTLNSKMKLANAYIDEEVLSRPSRAEQLRGFRTELLETIKSDSRIAEGVMVQAAEYLDERMFKLLLGLGRDSVPVTNDLVKAISKPTRGDGKMLILLEERGMDSEMTEEMVQFIAKNCGRNAMRSLMQKRSAHVKITSELLKTIVEGREAIEKMELLLGGKGADICVGANMAITEETVIEAAGNIYHGEKIIRNLLTRQGASIVITEEIMITAVANIHQGDTIIRELFAQQKANIVITEEVVIATIEDIFHGPRFIEVLLEKRGTYINITPGVMKAVSKSQEDLASFLHGSEPHNAVMMQLLENRGADMDVTEEMVRIITNEMDFPKESLALSVEKQGEKLRVTEGMVRMIEEKFPEEIALLETMKDNIRRYSSGSTGSAG
ncbi:uncharacterized protein EAE97_005890 [Botrytis byssoidea]|uniref:Heterokaryon incompatibility domain-containing protein n=1 Tax=Botrytis byssoidea TaxID=139641 RepID=A0A9P5INE5_9HELO|nr:uncharacterized protein EAE97_005890 [Botrytis byssoidea]KAF7943820.1 hypothetical protein EAE97_005890 [Botrytis byssoidea]